MFLHPSFFVAYRRDINRGGGGVSILWSNNN